MISDVYRMTPMQMGMLFHSLLDKESTAYFEHFLFSLKGEIDCHLLEKSFNALIERYDILRTIFHIEDKDQPLQIVLKQRKSKVYFKNIDHLSREEQGQYVQDFMAKDKKRGFDLTRDMLMRLSLLKTGKYSYKLIWSFHHILMDGWCLGIIFKELTRVYYSLKKGESINLEAVTPYAHYIKWLENQDKEQGLKYWREYLEGYEEPANMGKFGSGKSWKQNEYQVETYTFGLDEGITTGLNQISAAENATLNTLLQTIWGLLLQRYHNTDDVVYGAVVSGRPPEVPGIEKMIGLFINTIPVRITASGEKTFSQLIQNVQKKAALTKSYEYLPLAEIQAQSSLKYKLIDHIMAFENYPIEKQVKNNDNGNADKGLSLEVQNVKVYEQTNYHFNIIVSPGKRLFTSFNFNSLLFDMEFIKRTARHFNNIIHQVAENPNIFLGDIEIVTPEEKHQILFEFNDTRLEIPQDKTIHELFAARAEQTPDNIALVRSHESHSEGTRGLAPLSRPIALSYRELNNKSRQLSHLLRSKGVKPDTIVAIMAGRSIETITAILGILKAGGAYLPIDPQYPEERINYMLKDSGVEILLKESDFSPEALNNRPKGTSSHLHLQPAPATSLAYTIYTSGTTGNPKGVMIRHFSLVNFVYSMYKDYSQDFSPLDKCLSLTNFCFDVSVCEIFMPLVFGAGIVLLPYDKLFDPETLALTIVKDSITFTYIPPALLKEVYRHLKLYVSGFPLELNKMLVGVEPIQDEVLEDYLSLNPSMQIVNGYGPTEATICAAAYRYQSRQPEGKRVPIGGPLANTQILLLDKTNHPVAVGIPGELCISGIGLARGYLNHPELTAERFFSFFYKSYKSYRTHISRKVYRTGDLAQWLPDGNILFIGRTDQQVKIRGYRIELGEIEHHLLIVNTIKQTIVLARENKTGEKYLCAYIVPHKPVEDSSLRETLSRHLPDYMIPSYFIQLDKLPLTPNGKIDRKALPEPEVKTGEDGYQAPRDDVEEKLTKIWAEVLLGSTLKETNTISINDNFFNIGGDSIKAIQIAARLKKFGLKLEIKDLFANPTIKQLRKTITPIKRAIDQGPVRGEVQLTPIQQWFFENNIDHRHHFNQAVMIYRQEGFDENIIRQVFQQLVRHHDALRMVYQFNHNAPQTEKPVVLQTNRGIDENTEGKLLGLELFDFKQTGEETPGKEIQQEANRIQKSIDLEKGPLVKLGLFKTNTGDHLLIVIHHLVVDGISWRILLEDFATVYQQAVNHETLRFPPKTDSFKHWAQQLKTYAESPALLNQLEYWKHIEKISIPLLPEDFKISPAEKKIKNLRSLRLTLNPEQTRQLLKEVNQAYSTEINDILMAALALAVKDWAGIDKVFINLEGHGRQEIMEDMDISRTVGWFTSQYPVLLEMNYHRNLSYIIKHIKETLRQIPNKGIGYGILKYLTPADKKEGFAPRQTPGISFNYMGEFGSISQLHQENMFSLSEMRTGYQFSPDLEQWYAVNINGMIAQSQLVLDFSYNKYQYKPDTIAALLDGCKTHLLNIITHCVKKETKELTPSDLTYPHLSIDQLEAFTQQLGGIEDIYELTPMQAGMLFHALKNEESSAYVEQVVFSIEGHIDRDLLKKSFNILVERYDILRTLFYYEQVDQPLQIVLKHRAANIYFEDIGHLNQEAKNQYLKEFHLKDRKKGFDLSTDMLIRVSLLKTGKTAYKVAWTFPHILMDGWCTGIVFKELLYVYQRLSHNQTLELAPVTKYSSYIRWLKRQDKEKGLNYWRTYLEGCEEQANGQVPTLGKQKNEKEGQYLQDEYLMGLEQSLTNSLNRLARENRVTMNTLVQTLWGLLLQRYNNTDDVVFGTVVSGRPSGISGIEQMVGLFINTIPVRIKSNGKKPFSRLIKENQDQALKAKSYEYLPLADIQANSYLKRELIQHIMVFENYPLEKEVKNINETPDFYVKGLQSYEQTNYDFNMIVIPGTQLSIKFIFNSLLYEKEWVERISIHLKYMIEQIIESPNIEEREIEITPGEEKQRLLVEFNNTASVYPKDKTLQQIFAEQVNQTPDHIALIRSHESHSEGTRGLAPLFGAIAISYRELNKSSNQLAGLLIERGVKPDTIVAIMIERSLEMIIGLLGILKAGGAYLPIDPGSPKERINYMLKDSGAELLLKENDFAPEAFNNRPKGTSFSLHLPPAPATSLSYVIYTSGTSGKPKGTLITHANVIRIVKNTNYIELTGNDRILQLSSYAFDGSVFDIYGALLNGAALVLVDRDRVFAVDQLAILIRQQQITVFFVTTALFNILIDTQPHCFTDIRKVLFGGERVSPEHSGKALQYMGKGRVIHVYGPTETTVFATYYFIDRIEEKAITVPIGMPISNTTVYIQDRYDHLVPVGVTGEVVIGGDGVARGYLNNPELTGEKFINISSLFEGTRGLAPLLYRTGDLARWLSDGTIEFLGRQDFQVKIRGFRVEPAEIETQLLNHQAVKEAIVLVKEHHKEDKYLCAYIVLSHPLDPSELKAFLSVKLPPYMVPSYFIPVDKIPLTPNGKIDRKALPEPAQKTGQGYMAPRNEVEEILTGIWAEVLGIEKDKISIDANFFDLGGHSLKATMMVSKIRKLLNVQVPLVEVFETPGIKGISQYIAGLKEDPFISLEPVEKKEYYPLCSAQKRMYILNLLEGKDAVTYNISNMLQINGKLDIPGLEKAFKKLIHRHEALRTSFAMIEDNPVQIVHDHAAFNLGYKECDREEAKQRAKCFIRPFDLTGAPLMRVEVIKIDEKYTLMVDIHHIVADGTALQVLIYEFSTLSGNKTLPHLKIHYKDFAAWQNKLLDSGVIKNQEDYWLNRFKGQIPILDLPTDYPRPAIRSTEGDIIYFEIDKQLTKKTKNLRSGTGTTLYMLILAVYNILLSMYTLQEEIIVGTPLTGRNHADLQDIIGTLANLVAMKNQPTKDKKFTGFLKEVKENALQAYENQDFQFETLIEKLNLPATPGRHPLFDVVLNVINLKRGKPQQENKPAQENENSPIAPYPVEYHTAKYDLVLRASPKKDTLSMSLEYATTLFKKSTVENMVKNFIEILNQVVENKDITLEDITISNPFLLVQNTPDEEDMGFNF
jgi:iturin family lipopeptide synthetase B